MIDETVNINKLRKNIKHIFEILIHINISAGTITHNDNISANYIKFSVLCIIVCYNVKLHEKLKQDNIGGH